MVREDFFTSLWGQYTQVTPQALEIAALFSAHGESLINDHIAFRTFNKPGFGLDKLTSILDEIGYKTFDTYEFPTKHLRARALRVSDDPNQPKVFISELVCEELTGAAQIIIEELTSEPTHVLSLSSLIGTHPFQKPTFKQYSMIADESEYAAWLLTMGYQPNHFTVNINALKSFSSIEDVITLLMDNHYALNTVGDVIKGKPEDLLLQASTLADSVIFEFSDGTRKLVPSCFYEFAQRFKDHSGTLFQGFIPNNANAIFESTNRHKPR